MLVAPIIEDVNIATAILSNSMLIYLCMRFSKKNIGSYKHLLIIFASYDLFLTAIHFIIDPKIYNFGTVFTLHSARFPDNTWMTMIYVSCFTVPFALTNINFLHRYWAVKKPENLTLFTNPLFALLLSMYPTGEGVGWAWLSFQTGLDEAHYVQDNYYAKHNVTVTGWRVLHHWKDDQLNVPAFLIIFTASIIMTINFGIAIFLASQTISQIRKAKTFSFNYRNLQIKILRALFAQTAVPVLFVYIPFGCAIMFPFLKINDVYHISNMCMTMTSFFPAWDALVVILLIKDYRDGLTSLFCAQKSAASAATTIWMTQATTSMRLE